MTKLEQDLDVIGETYESFCDLNKLISEWAAKKDWYIVLNRIPKKGWLVYGLHGCAQSFHYIDLYILEDYFDKPTTMLNEFILKAN